MPGFSSHMISSAKANRALRKGRNNLFERNAPQREHLKPFEPQPRASKFIVKQLREKYRRERRQEWALWWVSLLAGIILIGITWAYLGLPVSW